MKKILLSLACVASVFSMSAQRASDTEATFFDSSKPEKLVHFGVRAGLNVSSISKWDDGESKCGFHAGLSADFAIMESFYINSGIFFTMKGVKSEWDEEFYDAGSYNYIGEGKIKESVNPMYIEIPVMASYRYNFNENLQWQLNFGPYFAFGIAGKFKEEYEAPKGYVAEEDWDCDFFGDDDDQYGGKRFDMGLGIGTGVTWNKIFFGINYQFGLTEVFKDSKCKNSNFQVSVGYNF